MVSDKASLKQIQESWKTVRIVEARIRTTLNSPSIFSFLPRATGFSSVPESLLLVFGVSVLEDALRQMRDEKLFQSQRTELSHLMKASKSVLPWKNYAEVEKIRLRRNRVAHQREFLPEGQCTKDLGAISRELLAWSILESDDSVQYTITITPNT